MFDHLFENRNSTVTNLLKLGDCLGRSLRENVEIFSIDSENKKVAYLTEGGKVLSGQYRLGRDISFENIKVQDTDIFSDNEVFDSFVNEKVSSFVGNLNSDDYGTAENSFSDILSLWENRIKFENVKNKLREKANLFSENQTIIGTDQFSQFLEVMPQFLNFLENNREVIQEVQQIENAIKLSNSVSKAFNFPKISFSKLEEDGSYVISKGLNKSVYELICKQELVNKELHESKKNFEDMWATNSKIRNLASMVFEESNETILTALVEAVIDVPFLALVTKKQLSESINNSFSLSEEISISPKELKTFVSKLFEMKKPIKKIIINLLNEKYGINVLNMRDTATFKGLASTQVVIFEALTRLAPKGSIIRETLSNLSKMLNTKNGVEIIDVNDILQECFEESGYVSFCRDFTLIEEMSFDDILQKETNVTELLEKTKEKLLLDKDKKNTEKELSPEDKKSKKDAEEDEAGEDCVGDEEDDSIKTAEKNLKKKVKEEAEEAEAEEPSEEEDSQEEEEPSGEEKKKEEPMSKEKFVDALSDLEALLGDSPPEEEDEEDEEEEEEEEEE